MKLSEIQKLIGQEIAYAAPNSTHEGNVCR